MQLAGLLWKGITDSIPATVSVSPDASVLHIRHCLTYRHCIARAMEREKDHSVRRVLKKSLRHDHSVRRVMAKKSLARPLGAPSDGHKVVF